MTATEEKLIEVGNALARAIGHRQGCYKLAPGTPCVCGAAQAQAKTLADWEHLIQQIRES